MDYCFFPWIWWNIIHVHFKKWQLTLTNNLTFSQFMKIKKSSLCDSIITTFKNKQNQNVTSHRFNTASNFLLLFKQVLTAFRSLSFEKKINLGTFLQKVKTFNKLSQQSLIRIISRLSIWFKEFYDIIDDRLTFKKKRNVFLVINLYIYGLWTNHLSLYE